jgi:DNA-binding response OmpR family regulator
VTKSTRRDTGHPETSRPENATGDDAVVSGEASQRDPSKLGEGGPLSGRQSTSDNPFAGNGRLKAWPKGADPPGAMNARPPLRILLVEDSTLQARFLEQTLRDMDPAPTEVAWVDHLATAVGWPGDSTDLVLLDLVLPDSEGIDTFRAVHEAHPELPIIVLSGTGDEALALLAVAEGAQDYLFKASVSPDALGRSIRYAVERHRKLMEQRRDANIDDLTGLCNRRGFTLLADQHLAMARRTNTILTALCVDVNGLKQVNDAFGHQDGDQLLAVPSWLWRDGATYPLLNDGFLAPDAYYLTGL